MDRADAAIKGWQAFKHSFKFGAASLPLPAPEIVERSDATCSQEPIGNGGYIAHCDMDRLDQQ